MNTTNDIYNVNEIMEVEDTHFSAQFTTVWDDGVDFDYCSGVQDAPVPGRSNERYVLWGNDDALPYQIISAIGCDEIMSQNKFFNVLTCYGSGLKLIDVQSQKPTTDPEIKRWMLRNSLPSYFLETATDMKYFFFSVALVVLSVDGTKINRIVHKEACYCRFEKANASGIIEHVYFANWQKGGLKPNEVERFPLLNMTDPLGDLLARMGKEPDTKGRRLKPTKDRVFAMVTRFPTPGNQYYPIAYYMAIFKGDWFEIKKLIGRGKRSSLRNHSPIKYHVEVHRDYWAKLCEERGAVDPVQRKEIIKQEKTNIRKFLTGVENSGKPWISAFYTDPNGKETHMVRINVVDTKNPGGDFSEDIAEAANTICYCDNIHPNLVGATPGKTQTNNSGSDKRELFTLKQALEIAFHDLMLTPIEVCIHYNGWQNKVQPTVPMVLLTTLDKNTDAQTINPKQDDTDPKK